MPGSMTLANARKSHAVRSYIESLNEILGCVAGRRVNVHGPDSRDAYSVKIGNGQHVPLASPSNLGVRVRQQFRASPVQSDFTVRVEAYEYAIRRASGGEILAYHWHPATQVSYPHLHISAEWGTAREFSRVHLPTGHLALVEFTLLLIREFAVVPQRSNWQRILIDESSPS